MFGKRHPSISWIKWIDFNDSEDFSGKADFSANFIKFTAGGSGNAAHPCSNTKHLTTSKWVRLSSLTALCPQALPRRHAPTPAPHATQPKNKNAPTGHSLRGVSISSLKSSPRFAETQIIPEADPARRQARRRSTPP